MEPGLPLAVLLSPVVIAAVAIAVMNLFGRDEDAPAEPQPTRETPKPPAWGAGPVASPFSWPKVTLTPARYVGGHPERAGETLSPLVALDEVSLRVAPGPRREPPFAVGWAEIEAIDVLDARQMRFASGSVRGLAPEAIPEERPDALYLRIRHIDPNGWWQHTVFELDADHAEAQAEAVREAHRQHRPGPPTSEPSADA